MIIGMTPLIPLNRVVPIPDARLQRFGVNNSELFGKPLISFGGSPLLPGPEAAPSQAPAQQAPEWTPETGTGAPKPAAAAAPALAPGYSRWTASSWTGAAAPVSGSMVDLKA